MPGKRDVKKSSTKSTGWGEVARKKQASAESSTERLFDFFLSKDGDSAVIQFLHEEPYCSDFFSIKVNGRWTTLNTQKAVKRHCLMEQEGLKSTWKAAFKVLDFRGKYSTETKMTEEEEGVPLEDRTPQEKRYLMNNTLANQIKTYVDKRKLDLTDHLFLVTRLGTGKTTTYSFEVARDEDDDKLESIEHKSESVDIIELCTPPSDDWLIEKGVVGYDEADEEESTTKRKL